MGECVLSQLVGVCELVFAVVTIVVTYSVVERTDVRVEDDGQCIGVHHLVVVHCVFLGLRFLFRRRGYCRNKTYI